MPDSLETALAGAIFAMEQTLHGEHQGTPFQGPFSEGSKASSMAGIKTMIAPFLLGFDEVEPVAKRMTKTATDHYPPFNIERVGADGSHAARVRITLAVAGFRADQLEVEAEKGRLTIRGRRTDERARVLLYRGIAARQFQRVFRFAETMEAGEAVLRDGLLLVDLIRFEPEPNVQKVEIKVRD